MRKVILVLSGIAITLATWSPATALNAGEFDNPKISSNLARGTDSLGNPAKNERVDFKLAASGKNLVMVWQDYRLNDTFGIRNTEIYIRNSADSGTTWGPIINLSSQPQGDWEPALALNESTAVVAFGTDAGICNGCPEVLTIKRFANGEAQTVFEGEKFLFAVDTSATSSGEKFFVSAGESEIFHTTSLDDGRTWSSLQSWKPSGNNDFSERSQARAFSDGNTLYQVARARVNTVSPHPDIVIRTSQDFGLTWNQDIQLSNTAQEEVTPVIFGNATEVFVAYGTRISERRVDIFVRSSKDSGRTWSQPTKLTSLQNDYYSFQGPILDMKTLSNGKHMGLLNNKEIVFSSDGKSFDSRRPVGKNVTELISLAIGSDAAFLVRSGVVYTSQKPVENPLASIPAKKYKNCSALNQIYPGGVAKSASSRNKGATTRQKPFVNSAVYNLNKGLDRDKDGIVCEK